jgi:hypothetical protein
MSPLACALWLAAIASVVQAEVYKWTGPDGRIHYSDAPPPSSRSDQKTNVRTGGSRPNEAPAAAPVKSIAEQEAEFKKRQVEEEEKRLNSEKQVAEAKERERNCANARGNLKVLEDGGRAVRYNEKGERLFVDDKDRPQLIADARKAVESWCR